MWVAIVATQKKERSPHARAGSVSGHKNLVLKYEVFQDKAKHLAAIHKAAGVYGTLENADSSPHFQDKAKHLAAEVFAMIENLQLELYLFQNKALHLAAIHKADTRRTGTPL